MQIEKTIELSIRTIVNRRMDDIVRDVKTHLYDTWASLQLLDLGEEGAARAKKKKKKRVIRCPVANCGRRGAGPKYGWACRKHSDLPKRTLISARKKLRGR